MSEIDVSDFCLVCYYDKETNKLARIEQYSNNSSDIQADIKSYEYGYNAIIIKPEQIIEQLQQLKYDVECAELRNKYDKEQFDNELQQLKAENEELHRRQNVFCILKKIDKYKQCLDEIEEIANANCLKCSNVASCDFDTRNCSDLKINEILQLIKQAKEGINE